MIRGSIGKCCCLQPFVPIVLPLYFMHDSAQRTLESTVRPLTQAIALWMVWRRVNRSRSQQLSDRLQDSIPKLLALISEHLFGKSVSTHDFIEESLGGLHGSLLLQCYHFNPSSVTARHHEDTCMTLTTWPSSNYQIELNPAEQAIRHWNRPIGYFTLRLSGRYKAQVLHDLQYRSTSSIMVGHQNLSLTRSRVFNGP